MVINRKDAEVLQEDKLVVLSDHDVKSIPLQRCNSHSITKSCGDCVALQDPYCAWDQYKGECVEHSTVVASDVDFSSSFSSDSGNLIQQLDTGFHTACPPDIYSIERVQATNKVEATDVASLLSNSTTIDNSLNVTNAVLNSSNESESTSTFKLNKDDTNQSDNCSNQCSCEICKDASLDNPSTTLKRRPNDKFALESVIKSSRKPSIPTFGAYNSTTLFDTNILT
jgi:hypothetical protein